MRNEIFSAIKEVIKSRGFNYKEVSKKIGLSESAFKKLMANEDCSMSKLTQICDVLNVTISDLIEVSETRSKVGIVMNKKQEAYFMKNPGSYHFFTELLENNYEWIKIKDKHSITKKKCLSILIQLDKLNLLKLEAGNMVTKVHEGGDITISSELGEKVAFDLDYAFFNYAQGEFKKNSPDAYGSRARYNLKKESINEMFKSMNEITNEFAKRSRREEILHDKSNLKEITLMTYISEGFRPFDHVSIE